MKISDFIDGRGVTYDTVRKYIVNHPELFKGHIGRTNTIVLDDVAIEILEKKYPFPDPVQVIQDTEAREKLQALTEKYIKVLEENKLLVEQNAQLLVTQAKQKYSMRARVMPSILKMNSRSEKRHMNFYRDNSKR